MKNDALPEPIRLLIVDDNAATRAATIALLEANGRPVTPFEASDGHEAIRLVERVKPDVVLMDVEMPRLDGISATRVIKQQRASTRVVMLSMYAGHEASAMEAGADDFLLKGEAIERLLAAVFEP